MADYQTPCNTGSIFRMLFLYCCCAVMVGLFVNFYSLYSLLLKNLGEGFIVNAPLILPFFIIPPTIYLLVTKGKSNALPFSRAWIFAGLVLCVIGLLIPDPNVGVKRIHVTEYLILSLLVRYTLSHRLSGHTLLVFASLLTAVLGIHDEFLQGLHPSRTYGLRDIGVNSVSALAGNLIWHGLQLFSRPEVQGRRNNIGKRCLLITYLSWLAISVLMMIIPINSLQYAEIPPYVLLPMGASVIFWSCFFIKDDNGIDHGVTILSITSFILIIYPVIINVFQIPFH